MMAGGRWRPSSPCRRITPGCLGLVISFFPHGLSRCRLRLRLPTSFRNILCCECSFSRQAGSQPAAPAKRAGGTSGNVVASLSGFCWTDNFQNSMELLVGCPAEWLSVYRKEVSTRAAVSRISRISTHIAGSHIHLVLPMAENSLAITLFS